MLKNHSAVSAQIRVVSADTESVLRRLSANGISLLEIEKEDSLTVKVSVRTADYKETIHLLDRWNVTFHVLNRHIDTTFGKMIASRFVLAISVAVLLLICMYIPGKILFVNVVGNSRIPSRRIIEEAGKKGIYFGAATSQVRSEKVKNMLLETIPELQWIGVNTNGCVATIYVEEKTASESDADEVTCISSIVASTDGVVESCTVTKGTQLCREGQAVSQNEVLISGYMDCGIILKATQAEGEVYAETLRNTETTIPIVHTQKTAIKEKQTDYSLRIGKKLINFHNSSGIYPGSCVKIYKEQFMVLPGGFCLPVSWIEETAIFYDTAEAGAFAEDQEEYLLSFTKDYLRSQMVAGSIKDESLEWTRSDSAITLKGSYICSEMIGRRKTEQILQGEYKSD